MSTPTLIERARALLEPWPPGSESCRRNPFCERFAKHEGDCVSGHRAPLDLAAFAVAFAEALPGLYREHRRCSAEVPVEERTEFKRRYTAAGQDGWSCRCGADDHNARLDALANKLGILSRNQTTAAAPPAAAASDHATSWEHVVSPWRILCDWCDEPANSIAISGPPRGRAINCKAHNGTYYSDLPSSPVGYYFKGNLLDRPPRHDNNWLRALPLADDALAILRVRNGADALGIPPEQRRRP